MARNSRKTIIRTTEETPGWRGGEDWWTMSATSDVGGSGTEERDIDPEDADASHNVRSSTNIAFRRSAISTLLLSLLPLPAAAYPQPKANAVRRDRRRSSSPWNSRGAERRLSERQEGNGSVERLDRVSQAMGGVSGEASLRLLDNENSAVTVRSSEVSPHRPIHPRVADHPPHTSNRWTQRRLPYPTNEQTRPLHRRKRRRFR